MQSKFVKCVALLAIVVILAGCGGQPTVVVPTLSSENVQATNQAIMGDAVKTVQADMTKNAPPTATPAPTNTPVPPTDTPVPPTATPAVTNTPAPTNTPVPPTRPAVTWTPTYTATVANASCIIQSINPAAAENTFTPGADFDAVWTVKNTSGSTWAAADTDAKYVSGQKMQKRVDVADITSDVTNGSTVTVIVDMVAPGSDGGYNAVWAIQSASKTVCTLPLSINVKK